MGWQVPRDERIERGAWQALADTVYTGGPLPSNGIVFSRCFHGLYEFFERCRRERRKHYVLLTANCDHGPKYQDGNPTYDRRFRRRSTGGSGSPLQSVGLQPLSVHPSQTPGRCFPEHRMVLRQHTHSHFTFDQLPSCVHTWFCTNVGVREGRIVGLPFGLHDGESRLFLEGPRPKPKNLVYLNFAVNNQIRDDLQDLFGSGSHAWATVYDNGRGRPSSYLRTAREFLEDLASHAFTCAPEGLGMDSYRV